MKTINDKQTKKKVATNVLTSLSKIADRPTNDKGNLEVEAFNKLSEVKNAISTLKKAGINKKWLFDNGFVAAGMILTF